MACAACAVYVVRGHHAVVCVPHLLCAACAVYVVCCLNAAHMLCAAYAAGAV